jgi:tetratricopeptide (TPR) repeat protein
MTREEAIAEYKALLVAEWSEENHKKTAALLASLLDVKFYDLTNVDSLLPLIVPSKDDFIFWVQSLFVNQLMHGLWTDLACEAEEEEWKKLGDGIYKYIEDYWDEDTKLDMLSTYYEGMGDRLKAYECARKSLELTPKDEVVYATRAQSVYFMLMDYGMLDEADKFLASLPEGVRKELAG